MNITKVFIALTLAVSSNVNAFPVKVDRVVDGDTINIVIEKHPESLKNVSVRILNLDTPELRGKCDKEKNLAKQAKLFLIKLLPAGSTIDLKNVKFDKYGGRVDADVEFNGQDVADLIKKRFLGVRYDGTGERKNWCE